MSDYARLRNQAKRLTHTAGRAFRHYQIIKENGQPYPEAARQLDIIATASAIAAHEQARLLLQPGAAYNAHSAIIDRLTTYLNVLKESR